MALHKSVGTLAEGRVRGGLFVNEQGLGEA